MAPIGQPSPVLPVEPDQPVEAVVERAGQVGRRPAGLAAADRAILQDRDAKAFLLGQEVGRRQPGDAGAHDGDVDLQVLAQQRK